MNSVRVIKCQECGGYTYIKMFIFISIYVCVYIDESIWNIVKIFLDQMWPSIEGTLLWTPLDEMIFCAQKTFQLCRSGFDAKGNAERRRKVGGLRKVSQHRDSDLRAFHETSMKKLEGAKQSEVPVCPLNRGSGRRRQIKFFLKSANSEWFNEQFEGCACKMVT